MHVSLPVIKRYSWKLLIKRRLRNPFSNKTATLCYRALPFVRRLTSSAHRGDNTIEERCPTEKRWKGKRHDDFISGRNGARRRRGGDINKKLARKNLEIILWRLITYNVFSRKAPCDNKLPTPSNVEGMDGYFSVPFFSLLSDSAVVPIFSAPFAGSRLLPFNFWGKIGIIIYRAIKQWINFWRNDATWKTKTIGF